MTLRTLPFCLSHSEIGGIHILIGEVILYFTDEFWRYTVRSALLMVIETLESRK